MKETKKDKTLGALEIFKDGIPKEILARITEQSPDGLRGRISELRKEKNVDIVTFKKEFTCYKLQKKRSPSSAKKINCGEPNNLSREWTYEEEEFLRDNVFRLPFKHIVSKLSRPYDEVKMKCKFMGMIWRDRIHKSDGSIEKV